MCGGRQTNESIKTSNLINLSPEASQDSIQVLKLFAVTVTECRDVPGRL